MLSLAGLKMETQRRERQYWSLPDQKWESKTVRADTVRQTIQPCDSCHTNSVNSSSDEKTNLSTTIFNDRTKQVV